MNRPRSFVTLAGTILLSIGFCTDSRASEPCWVTQDSTGALHYQLTEKGDRIADFSHCGYGGGGVAIPNVPVMKKVVPSGGDDTGVIQSALDQVGQAPLTNGLRGTVLLGAGTFHCSAGLKLLNSGVVIRGSGSGDGGTVIEMSGTPHTCITILGSPLQMPKLNPEDGIVITDDYIPSGTNSLSLAKTSGLNVGDDIVIQRKCTQAWIHSLGMDTLVRNGKPQTWIHTNQVLLYQRKIKAVAEGKIQLDVPLPDAIDSALMAPDKPTVFKLIGSPARLSECGIESLKITSAPPAGDLKVKQNNGIDCDNCEDCWISDVNMVGVVEDVNVLSNARRMTLSNIHAFHEATVAAGAGYPADFTLRGSQNLVDRCSSTGHGSFYIATSNLDSNLNAVLNCNFYGTDGSGGAIQPHSRWSTALLVDGCNLPDGKIEFINRTTAGSGHGWAMAWGVAWNCTAKSLNIQQPPGVINWCIGCSGALDPRTGMTPGISFLGRPVEPKSLYLAQLKSRLGEGALRNIGY